MEIPINKFNVSLFIFLSFIFISKKVNRPCPSSQKKTLLPPDKYSFPYCWGRTRLGIRWILFCITFPRLWLLLPSTIGCSSLCMYCVLHVYRMRIQTQWPSVIHNYYWPSYFCSCSIVAPFWQFYCVPFLRLLCIWGLCIFDDFSLNLNSPIVKIVTRVTYLRQHICAKLNWIKITTQCQM
jgi:hypothetical protein